MLARYLGINLSSHWGDLTPNKFIAGSVDQFASAHVLRVLCGITTCGFLRSFVNRNKKETLLALVINVIWIIVFICFMGSRSPEQVSLIEWARSPVQVSLKEWARSSEQVSLIEWARSPEQVSLKEWVSSPEQVSLIE